jgi:hypothetical protein
MKIGQVKEAKAIKRGRESGVAEGIFTKLRGKGVSETGFI